MARSFKDADAMFSRKSDHWGTPPEVYDPLHAEFGFTFDPCPLKSDEDGLKRAWSGRVFCNPPYSNIAGFIKKAIWHLHTGDVQLAVFLVPARTDTAWFHDYCYGKAEIRFCRGRIKFNGARWTAPFPSMVIILREANIAALPLEAA